jgi:hypothetical protein
VLHGGFAAVRGHSELERARLALRGAEAEPVMWKEEGMEVQWPRFAWSRALPWRAEEESLADSALPWQKRRREWVQRQGWLRVEWCADALERRWCTDGVFRRQVAEQWRAAAALERRRDSETRGKWERSEGCCSSARDNGARGVPPVRRCRRAAAFSCPRSGRARGRTGGEAGARWDPSCFG